MKSYTDLVQSRKLSEILPLESADFFWIIGHLHTDGPKYEIIRPINEVYETDKYWPCWSLAALISILPQSIEFKGDDYYLRFMKEYVEYANDEISITGRCLHTTDNDNLVDKKIRVPVNEWNSSVTTWIPDKSIKTNIY